MADKNQKRAPDDRPALSFFRPTGKQLVGLLSIAAVYLLLALGWVTLRPDLFVDPIDRTIHIGFLTRSEQEMAPLDMVPSLFSVGQDCGEAELRLRQAGYRPEGRESGTLTFAKYGPRTSLNCQSVYTVALDTDVYGRLAGVKGRADQRCV